MARRIALMFVLALLVSACGKSSSSGGTSTSEWANGFCSAITSWTTSIKDTGKKLQSGNISKESLKTAAQSFEDSTNTLADDLKALGKPDTDVGKKAAKAVDELADKVQQDAQEIKSAVDKASGLKETQAALAGVSTTLTTMGTQVSSTFAKLSDLDAKGELEKAFKDAPACKTLASQSG
jgi:chromosome segregation ATPase